MQTPLVLKQGTTTAQVSMQPGMVTVPMTVNSSMAGSIPNVMTLNKTGGQNVVVTTQNLGTGQPILPNVQILNMRPGAPTVAAQKSVAAVSPRVVIGTPQVVGTRAAPPGITLQTLQSLQPGQQGHLLLKTENGQYQLLRVGPAPAASTMAAPPPQTIRLSTVPAHPGVATVSTSIAQGAMAGLQGPMAAPVVHASVAGGAIAQAPQQQHQSSSNYVKPSDNTKEKCRNFLANLLDLSSKEPPSVEVNVRNLIQELIDAQVEPEEFCDRLERLLNASPQPCLIGFLKKSLPLLRQSLVTKELVIEGINPPAPHVAFMNLAPTAQPAVAANMQMVMTPLLVVLDAYWLSAAPANKSEYFGVGINTVKSLYHIVEDYIINKSRQDTGLFAEDKKAIEASDDGKAKFDVYKYLVDKYVHGDDKDGDNNHEAYDDNDKVSDDNGDGGNYDDHRDIGDGGNDDGHDNSDGYGEGNGNNAGGENNANDGGSDDDDDHNYGGNAWGNDDQDEDEEDDEDEERDIPRDMREECDDIIKQEDPIAALIQAMEDELMDRRENEEEADDESDDSDDEPSEPVEPYEFDETEDLGDHYAYYSQEVAQDAEENDEDSSPSPPRNNYFEEEELWTD